MSTAREKKHSMERAVETVRAHDTWVLTSAQSAAFVDAILNPPAPTEEMQKSLARYLASRAG